MLNLVEIGGYFGKIWWKNFKMLEFYVGEWLSEVKKKSKLKLSKCFYDI